LLHLTDAEKSMSTRKFPLFASFPQLDFSLKTQQSSGCNEPRFPVAGTVYCRSIAPNRQHSLSGDLDQEPVIDVAAQFPRGKFGLGGRRLKPSWRDNFFS
jgi:hypothetical protein